MMATATVSSASPRYAPEDPTLPKPWKGLVDGKTVYLYFWNPESNVTQYEKLAASSHTGSAPPQKLSSAPVSSSVQVEQSSHGHCDSIFNNDDDRYNGGSNSGSKLDTGTRSYQFLTLAFRLKYCPMGCINSICMRSLLNYVKHSLSHPFSHSISEKARNGASLLKFYGRSADSLSQYFGDPARCPFEQDFLDFLGSILPVVKAWIKYQNGIF